MRVGVSGARVGLDGALLLGVLGVLFAFAVPMPRTVRFLYLPAPWAGALAPSGAAPGEVGFGVGLAPCLAVAAVAACCVVPVPPTMPLRRAVLRFFLRVEWGLGFPSLSVEESGALRSWWMRPRWLGMSSFATSKWRLRLWRGDLGLGFGAGFGGVGRRGEDVLGW